MYGQFLGKWIHSEHKPFVRSDSTTYKLSSKHRRNAAYYLKHPLNISVRNRSRCRSPTDIAVDDSVWTQSAYHGGTQCTTSPPADPLIHSILLGINYPVKPVIKTQLPPSLAKSLVAKRRHGRVPLARTRTLGSVFACEPLAREATWWLSTLDEFLRQCLAFRDRHNFGREQVLGLERM